MDLPNKIFQRDEVATEKGDGTKIKINKLVIFPLALLFVGSVSFASPWAGPGSNIAGGLLSPSKPTNYIDGSFLGTFDSSPYTEARGRVNYVILQDEIDSLQTTLKVQQSAFSRGMIFGDPNSTAIPTQLTDFDLSLTYKHKLENGNDWGLNILGGSDSNVPFNSIYEVDWGVTGTYHIKVDELHSWLLFLNYSYTRSFLPGVPLPGAGYLVVNPENHTQVFIGVPFFIAWQPDSDCSFSLSYFIPTNIDAEASRKISDAVKIHLNFQWTNELWLIANRADNSQHLIFDQKRIILGMRSSFWDNFFADVFGGFVFDQTLLLGKSITDKNMPNVNLPAGFLAQGELAYRF